MTTLSRAAVLSLLLLMARPCPSEADEPINRLLNLTIPQSFAFCGEAVPLDREDVLERLDLELMDTLGSQMRTALWLTRVPRYFPAIEAALREKGLPQDLKYVAVIESNLRDDAVSSAGAAGPWQFMRTTAEACGLEKSDWRDPVRSWEDSTQAALAHLTDLRQAFSSWALVLAAYNAGSGRVKRAMEAQGMADFYGLRLPRETERYVFRAFAAKLVIENPEQYGIQLKDARLYFPEETEAAELRVERRSAPLWAVARAAEVSYRMLFRLNPWLTGSDLPRGTHPLRIPKESKDRFQLAYSRWEAENREPRTVRYRVRGGDTLASVARRHGVDVDDLRAWNNLGSRSQLKKGQELLLYRED